VNNNENRIRLKWENHASNDVSVGEDFDQHPNIRLYVGELAQWNHSPQNFPALRAGVVKEPR